MIRFFTISASLFALLFAVSLQDAEIRYYAQSWWEDFRGIENEKELRIENEEEKIRDLYDQIAQHVGLQKVPELYLSPETTDELCGKRRSVNITIKAYYCRANRSIAVTQALLYETIDSDSTLNLSLAFVLAHELAHARQHEVTGFTAGNLVSFVLIDELQADCIAGSVLKLSFPEDKQLYAEGRETAHSFGDYNYFSSFHHGNPDLREFVFQLGYIFGQPEFCLSHPAFDFEDPKPIDFLRKFPREFVADMQLRDIDLACDLVKEFTDEGRNRQVVTAVCFTLETWLKDG